MKCMHNEVGCVLEVELTELEGGIGGRREMYENEKLRDNFS